MVDKMGRLGDAFWRAAVYCLHPRVIALSVLPLLIAAGLCVGLAYFFWESAVDAVRGGLESWLLVGTLLRWLNSMGAEDYRAVIAPLLVIALAVPVVLMLSMLLVSTMMTPALVSLVAERRFTSLEKRRGAGFVASVLWSLGCSIVALVVVLLSMPLWLVPPMVLVLPPLIWGWLSFKVFAFDALAEHASAEERKRLMHEHRAPLLAIGVVSGYLGAAPSVIWAFSALAVVLAPLLVLVTVWLYTLVFAFSSLWFTHYCLSALAEMRGASAAAVIDTPVQVAQDNLPPPPLLP
jgi:MFS family permease